MNYNCLIFLLIRDVVMKRIVAISALLWIQGAFAELSQPTSASPMPLAMLAEPSLPATQPEATEKVIEESMPAASQTGPAVVEEVVEVAPSVTAETVVATPSQPSEEKMAVQKPVSKPASTKKETFDMARIAVLTMDKLMMGNKRYAAEVAPMRREVEARSEVLKRRAAELEDARRMNKKAPADIAKEEANLRIDFQAFNNEMQEREQQLQMSIMKAASEAVEVVAKDMGVDIVFPKTLYAVAKFDITDRVLVAMNKAYDAEVAASKFKKAQEEKPQAEKPAVVQKPAAPAAQPAAKPAAKKAAPKVKAPAKAKAA